MKPEIIVASASPHRFAGKKFITGSEVFALDEFDKEQLLQMLNDTMLTVVVGTKLTAENLDEFLAAREEQLAIDGDGEKSGEFLAAREEQLAIDGDGEKSGEEPADGKKGKTAKKAEAA